VRHPTAKPDLLKRPAWALVLLSLAASTSAHAFAGPAHRMLTERALRRQVGVQTMANPTDQGLVNFWVWLGGVFAMDSGERRLDGADPERFRSRYASEREWDAFAVRGFLALAQTPTPSVLGLDELDRSEIVERFNTVINASAAPDLDRRNQERFAYDAQRQVRKLPDGRPIPADPSALNMGRATGLSSQAHAHYQLGAEQPTDDPAALEREPWNFVAAFGWPGTTVDTWAAQMAQMHLDLAIMARYWGIQEMNSHGEYLAMVWLGAGLHYVQDVAGPLHTVQVGSYTLFKRAKLQYWWLALKTGGGTWGVLPAFASLGLDFLSNHHLFAEAWLLEQLERARDGRPALSAIAKAWQEAEVDDPTLLRALGDLLKPHLTGPLTQQPWQSGEGAATVLVRTLAKLGSRDGGALYDAAARASATRLSRPGTVLPDDASWSPDLSGDPDDADVRAAEAEMAAIHARSVRRATTAARLYWAAFEQGSPDAAARRLRRVQLDYLDREERLQAEYAKRPPAVAASSVREPAWLYGEVGFAVVLLVVGTWAWRRRRRALA
jgi:hypothetical protein